MPEISEGCRSTRIPALEMYWNFGGALAHYGGWAAGAANVNTYIRKLKVDSQFDGYSGSKHYYRNKKRKMPHNAVAELQDMLADTPEVEERQMQKFSADHPTDKGEEVNELTITFRKGYVSSFKYNAEDNTYAYYFNGKQFKDGSDGTKRSFANVMVIKFDYWFADEHSNTPMIDSIGTHIVEYYIGGKHFTGTCERESIFDPTKFLDDEGMKCSSCLARRTSRCRMRRGRSRTPPDRCTLPHCRFHLSDLPVTVRSIRRSWDMCVKIWARPVRRRTRPAWGEIALGYSEAPGHHKPFQGPDGSRPAPRGRNGNLLAPVAD